MSLFTNASSALWSYVAGQLTDRAENVVEAASTAARSRCGYFYRDLIP